MGRGAGAVATHTPTIGLGGCGARKGVPPARPAPHTVRAQRVWVAPHTQSPFSHSRHSLDLWVLLGQAKSTAAALRHPVVTTQHQGAVAGDPDPPKADRVTRVGRGLGAVTTYRQVIPPTPPLCAAGLTPLLRGFGKRQWHCNAQILSTPFDKGVDSAQANRGIRHYGGRTAVHPYSVGVRLGRCYNPHCR